MPNWAAVAGEWDGVHMTLGGLLTAEQVRVDGPKGWTQHRFWDAELTVWLRWVFTEVVRLPDLEEAPGSPVELGWPAAFRFEDEKPWRKLVCFLPVEGSG